MNVDETKATRNADAWLGLEKFANTTASTRFGADFDDGDLAFFQFLTQAGPRGIAKGQLATPDEAALGVLEPAQKEEAKTVETKIKSGEQLLKATVEVVQAADEVSRKKVAQALEMLDTQLTADDVRVLDQIVVNGMMCPGGLPFQQFVPLTPGGKPDFSRLGASDAFTEKLSEAYKQNRSLRVALDDRSAVILKFTGGKVSAEFLTQDAAMASYLKSSMDELRQRLAAKNLPVADLLYRDNPQGQQEQHHPHQRESEK